MPHGVFVQGTEILYNPYGFGIPYEGETTKTGMPHQTKLVLRTDGFMLTQSFSVQRPTNCQGSVPFPKFALFTWQASPFVSIWSVVS